MKKNDKIKLEITGMTAEGSGVGHADGMAVFVEQTAVGDIISAHILKTKKSYAFAKIDEIITPSPARVEPDCPVFARCGGCVYRHISYDEELKIKQQRVSDAFERIAKLPLKFNNIIGSDLTDGYRNKAQLPVRSENGKTEIGFFSPRSHRITDCGACRLQPKKFGEIVATFRQWIDEFGISLYDETSHTGLLRHIYLRSSKSCNELLVCAVINGAKLPHSSEIIERCFKLGATGFVLNINRERTNVILGEKCVTLAGKGTVTDTLCGVKFEISPLSFYQVNRAQAEKLYTLAAQYAQINSETTLLDMYCGVGTIGLTMAKKAKQLIGVEIVEDAVEDAKKNTALNSIENARFICGDAAQAAAQLDKEHITPDVVILDPPRKGCDSELIDTVVKMNPERIVYVSCDPATLARDYALFAEKGYVCPETNGLHAATAVDMFPRTQHVETVILMNRIC